MLSSQARGAWGFERKPSRDRERASLSYNSFRTLTVGSISAGGAQPPVMGQSNLGQDTRGLPGMSPARGEYRRMGKVGWGVGGGW